MDELISRIISRRQFLRSGSWAVAGAIVVPVAAKIFLPPCFYTPWDPFEHYRSVKENLKEIK